MDEPIRIVRELYGLKELWNLSGAEAIYACPGHVALKYEEAFAWYAFEKDRTWKPAENFRGDVAVLDGRGPFSVEIDTSWMLGWEAFRNEQARISTTVFFEKYPKYEGFYRACIGNEVFTLITYFNTYGLRCWMFFLRGELEV